MLGRHKFYKGQRVQPSAEGVSAGLFTRHKDGGGRPFVGTVEAVDRFNSPRVHWDGYKTASKYHPDFIEPIVPPEEVLSPESDGQ